MTINGKIKGKKVQYNVNWKAAKTSALSSGKIFKYNKLQLEKYYFLVKEKIIEQTWFIYSALVKYDEQKRIWS